MTPDLLEIPPGSSPGATGAWREPDLEAGVDALARLVALRDVGTASHSADVAELSVRVGRALGLETTALTTLERAARLHDLGKVAIPDRILWKAGPLDRAEWALMRHHPAWGAGTVGLLPGLSGVADAVRAHHERWDGSGYPDALAGAVIPIESRIIAVCDAFSAMTTDRPYAPALAVDEALAELRAGAGRQFDAAVVDALVALLRG